jgi:hypothetical protein
VISSGIVTPLYLSMLSESAKAPFEGGGGKFVFAERTAEQMLVTIGALKGTFGTFGHLGTGGMREKTKDVFV